MGLMAEIVWADLDEKAQEISKKFSSAFAQVAAQEGLQPVKGAQTMALAMVHSSVSALMYAHCFARGGRPPADQESEAYQEVLDELAGAVDYARALAELATGRPTKQ